MIAKRVFFFGRVQGVGFRYTTVQLLRDLSLQGYVRNLEDGSVELFLQGEEEQVEEGIRRTLERWVGHIEKKTVQEEPTQRGMSALKIL